MARDESESRGQLVDKPRSEEELDAMKSRKTAFLQNRKQYAAETLQSERREGVATTRVDYLHLHANPIISLEQALFFFVGDRALDTSASLASLHDGDVAGAVL